jgi:hypothetical protein
LSSSSFATSSSNSGLVLYCPINIITPRCISSLWQPRSPGSVVLVSQPSADAHRLRLLLHSHAPQVCIRSTSHFRIAAHISHQWVPEVMPNCTTDNSASRGRRPHRMGTGGWLHFPGCIGHVFSLLRHAVLLPLDEASASSNRLQSATVLCAITRLL